MPRFFRPLTINPGRVHSSVHSTCLTLNAVLVDWIAHQRIFFGGWFAAVHSFSFAGIIARLARSERFALGCDRFPPEMSAVLSWSLVVCFVFTTC